MRVAADEEPQLTIKIPEGGFRYVDVWESEAAIDRPPV
jgi:hypothetical protein